MSHKAIDRQASKMTTASSPASGESKEKKSVARYILFKFSLLKGLYTFDLSAICACIIKKLDLKLFDVAKNTQLTKFNNAILLLVSYHVS